MDLVKEFKSKLNKFTKETGWKYKVLYKGYEEALKENRLSCYFHKPCKLAEVTTPEGVITIEIVGELKADLHSPEGYLMSFKDYIPALTPFDTTTVDDVGISHEGIYIAEDKDLDKLLSGDGWKLELDNASYIQATLDGERYEYIDLSIAKAVFNTDAINLLMKAKKEHSEELVETEEVPEETEKASEKTEKTSEKTEIKPEEVKKESKKSKKTETKIKDSGNRTEFESGAVRDIQKGKGRCDLLPLDIVDDFFKSEASETELGEIALFQKDVDPDHLVRAAKKFAAENFPDSETAILEYACHLEDGCEKYGDRNWEKGIPLSRYIDSGIRHFLKFKRGDDDERHDRAFIWNMLCGAWTCKHHPDLKER